MKIWIFGDSFANNDSIYSWVSLLAKSHTVINKSSNGSSEYRIYKTYNQHKDQIHSTDHVLFVHTSSSRIYLREDQDLDSRKLNSHKNCDLIFSDIYHKKEQKYIDILESIWDDTYFDDNYLLLLDKMLNVANSTHITFFENHHGLYSYYDTYVNNKGSINHMNEKGNVIVYNDIVYRLTKYKRLLHFGASLTSGQGLNSIEDAYPYKLGQLTNIESINNGIPGASNLQVLHDILNYKFVHGDVAIIMWAPCNRDTLFENGKLVQIGAWQESEIAKNWILTHSDSDLTVRTWYHIHQATLYLESINVPYYNFAGYSRPLLKYKPDYINIELIDSNMSEYRERTEYAIDGHPGPDAHTLLAHRMLDIIK